MNKFQDILKGGDLRSIGKANKIVAMVNNQTAFDELFEGLTYSDRKVVMRTADAIEKITLRKSDYLQKHKIELLNLCQSAKDIELKWHLALLVSRLNLTQKELGNTWDLLTKWASDRKESKIVRVNSIQGLFNLLQQNPSLSQDFNLTLSEIGKENVASLNARIKKLQNASR
ncbi:hypothetical protein KIH23_10305 [Flavobacterium sp. CYK-55]|uniref:hypothetical protein n=1 Tax=Flavobacterium sp. CYK-55 TaxID=2835529 RepID=UPI001BD08CA9|nr:hypothetical protein [Flavobacterium sp. CYK-55]MBS7787690.1 hypothetical protein [Flavobacterium sp. CYK-55]